MLEKFLEKKLQKLGYAKIEALEEQKQLEEEHYATMKELVFEAKDLVVSLSKDTGEALRQRDEALAEACERLEEKINDLTLDLREETKLRRESDTETKESLQEEIDKKEVSWKNPVIKEINGHIKVLTNQTSSIENKLPDYLKISNEYNSIKKMNEDYKYQIEKVCTDTVHHLAETEKKMAEFDDLYNSMLISANRNASRMVSQKWSDIEAKLKGSDNA